MYLLFPLARKGKGETGADDTVSDANDAGSLLARAQVFVIMTTMPVARMAKANQAALMS
jgi:hypothetical protein